MSCSEFASVQQTFSVICWRRWKKLQNAHCRR